jgi:NAD-dependent deacetylase
MDYSTTFSTALVERLASAERVAVLTGAGVSAESGITTFRDPGGLWQQFRPEELANFDAFIRNPALVQGWYAYRRKIALEKAPNPGHHALARMEELYDDFTLVTQNVDNLHRRAGSRHILELHGNIIRNYCVDCRRPAADTEIDGHDDGEVMRCLCSGPIRPDVVWFGEMLPAATLQEAAEAAGRCEVFLSIGTSAIVYPAAQIPLIAIDSGAYVAEINIEPSALAGVMSEVILGPSGVVLPALLAAVKARQGTTRG